MAYKNPYIIRCAGAFLAGLVCCGLSAFTAHSSAPEQTQQIQAIQAAFLGAVETQISIGCFPSDSGRTADLPESERRALQEEYEETVNRYYSTDNACRKRYIELNEACLDGTQSDVSYTVSSGVLDYRFDAVQVSEDFSEAEVKASYVVYEERICNTDTQQFEIAVPVNQDTVNARMVQEDGLWKLQSIDSLSSLDTAFTDDAVCSGTYPSFASALQAARRINKQSLSSSSYLSKG